MHPWKRAQADVYTADQLAEMAGTWDSKEEVASVKTAKYEVVFNLPASHGGGQRKITVDVIDTGKKVDEADAILEASLILDKDGITWWGLAGCTKITS